MYLKKNYLFTTTLWNTSIRKPLASCAGGIYVIRKKLLADVLGSLPTPSPASEISDGILCRTDVDARKTFCWISWTERFCLHAPKWIAVHIEHWDEQLWVKVTADSFWYRGHPMCLSKIGMFHSIYFSYFDKLLSPPLLLVAEYKTD